MQKHLTWCGVKKVAYDQHLVYLSIKINNGIIYILNFTKFKRHTEENTI